MSADIKGNQTLPTEAPTEMRDWVLGLGETTTQEWTGERGLIDAKYELLKSIGQSGTTNLQSLSTSYNTGRARLTAKYLRITDTNSPTIPANVQVIEELYGIDVIKDICEAPYFWELEDDYVAYVRKCAQEMWTKAEIDENAPGASFNWASWTTLMKELYKHILKGASYIDTSFVLRISYTTANLSNVQASFNDINRVVSITDEEISPKMKNILDSLPSTETEPGEWLYRQPRTEYLQNGKWRLDREWQWARAWSVVYGGTWGAVA